MQDTVNLKKKLKEYKKILKAHNHKELGVPCDRVWYENQLIIVEGRIKERNKNRLKNMKQYKKAN